MQPNPFPPLCAEKFAAQRLLASGGYACVYLAKQRGLERPVAVKLLFEHLLDDADEVGRFRDEARITASFHHPGIVTVIDHDVESGVPWIAYEYLSGRCLRDMLKDGALPLKEALGIAIQVAAALEEVHGLGILHRDIKPENVVEALPGRFKITDFGIAKSCTQRRSRTHTGEIPGTVYYVAPELIEGTPPSAQSDVYALGIMLYELITGGVPFFGDGPVAVCKRHIEGAIPAASRQVPGVPAALDRLLFTALAKEPRDRFASARQMREEMEKALAALELPSSGLRRRANPRVATPKVIAVPASRPVRRGFAPLIAALAGAVTAAVILATGVWRAPVDRAVASGFHIMEHSRGTGLAGSAALTLVRQATAKPAPPAKKRPLARVDEGKLTRALAGIADELTVCRRITMDLVAVLAPLASVSDQEQAEVRARKHQQRLEKLHARAVIATEATERADLASRARALAFVTWTQIEATRRVHQVAEWSQGNKTFSVTGWEDSTSPLGRAHYGDAGVPRVAAFLETALDGIKHQAERGAQAGPELADLLSDVQLVAQAAAQAEWEPQASAALAPHIQAFKTGLNELTGREAQSMRWTAWCLWSWAEAGRAQANGKFYRKAAVDELGRLCELVPPARAELAELAARLRTVWKVR